MELTKVNEAGNLNVLLLGIGGMIWIPPLYFWVRASARRRHLDTR